ncbi:MAG: HRDC domain-containing protein [Planctomycetota bacterium]
MSLPRPKPPAELAPPELVEDAAGLARLLAALAPEREVAVDTEADSFYHYQERVCLLQITAGGRDWLVDPLQGLDIRPLGELLADPARTKVFHDGEYDILILKRQFGFRFANLFDTRIAAAALGMEAPGLAAVVAQRYGYELDKSQQRSDWSRRPLSGEQVAYARLDTHYLVPLMHELRPELDQKGRMRILRGECARLEALEPPERSFHPDEFLKLKGARKLNLLGMRALRELFVLREEHARARDLPPFKVLAPQALVTLAEDLPASKSQLEHHVPPGIVRRLGAEILAALKRAEAAGPLPRVPELPTRSEEGDLDEVQSELHERLKQWRKQRAQKEGLDSALVLNRRVLLRLAELAPRERAQLASVEGLLDWQIELFGDELLSVVNAFQRDLAEGKVELRRRRRG